MLLLIQIWYNNLPLFYKQVEFVDTIPKLASGKIQRKVLREAEEKKRNE